MCHPAPPEGFYGYVARFPDDLILLWVMLLAPLGELLCIEGYRFLQPETRLFTLPALRLPEASTELQSFRWYLGQLALLLMMSGVLVCVELPTEPAWGAWLKQVQSSVQPACVTDLQAIITVHNWINVAVISLGIFAPLLIVLIREFSAMYPRAR